MSAVGDWLYNVALLALVYERTHSPTWVAFTTAARVLPMVVAGPFGGAVADRVDRRALIAASDLVRAGMMVALAAVAAFGGPIVLAPLLAALAVAAGTVHPPAVAASAARLVDDSELPRAAALRSAIGQTAIVAGPALGALLLMAAGPALAILVNGLTFLASAAAVLAIAPGPAFRPGAACARTGWLTDIRAGAQALRGAPVAVRLIAADVLCSMVYGFLTVALVLVSGRLGGGDAGYGVLLGGFGAGGIAGALLAGRIEARAGWRRMLAGALVLVALPMAALGAVPGFAAAIA